ncbi:hypothetical protein BDU57DRAFT_508439 [Ampelomyces quisqualis]|uniref:Gamma-glutamylcyclotransferase AIG2-like domain-containing protein n=1 Tax=Ampelomyces quisqualis TaxID=50730 RepID=A0A6A5QXU2_AMPQU|nr:hypothetical protein BDU57DRAFT_508439 [Ampelomyces quisqualis]
MSKSLGGWELFVKDDVDDYISRLGCVPEIERKNRIYLHKVSDEEENIASVITLRTWEAALLRKFVPPAMRYGRYIYYTGSWGSLSLAWARKDLREPGVQTGALSQSQHSESTFRPPLQDKYPIWYFLTGQIARRDKLKALWKLDEMPLKRPAYVTGLTTINHINRKAPIISQGKNEEGYTKRCVGVAYLVKDKLAETRLRYFKTDRFKVVSCEITLQPLCKHGKRHKINGLTFVLTDLALETMDQPIFAVAGQSEATYFERRTGNLDYVESTDLPMEPSLAFDGSITLGVEEATLKRRNLEDQAVMVYPFPIIKQGRPCSAQEHRARIETIRYHGPFPSKLATVTNALDLPAPSSSTPETWKIGPVPGSSDPPRHSEGNLHISRSDRATKDSIAWWAQPLRTSITSHIGDSGSRTDEDSTVVHIEEVGLENSSDEIEVKIDTAASEATLGTVESNASTHEATKVTSSIAATITSNDCIVDEVVSELSETAIPVGEGNLSLPAVDAGGSSSTLTDTTDASSNTLVAGESAMPNSALEDILNILVDVVLSFFLHRIQGVLDATMSEAVELDEFEDDGMNGGAR